MLEYNINQGIPKSEQPNTKIRVTYSSIFLGMILCCALLTGIAPQTIVSVLAVAASAGLCLTGQIHLAFPVMIFYYSSFGTLAGMSVYRYYSFFLLLDVVIKNRIVVQKWQVAPLLMFMLYVVCVVFPDNLRRGIFVLVDILCVIVIINGFLNDAEGLKRFFTIYVVTAFAAYFTGLVIQSTVTGIMQVGNEYMEISRNYATFEDPNYAGLFYSVGIFATLTLELFHPKIRALVVICLSCIILTTLSISALLINALLWVIYLCAFRKVKPITLICVVAVLAILVGLYQYGLQNPDAPVVGMFSYRIQDKLQALEQRDYNEVTTNRTDSSADHLQYFANQSPFRMLVGMNGASVLKLDERISNIAAHNEYVDLLLNLGVIGTVIYLGVFLIRTVQCYQAMREQRDARGSCIFMMKMIWMLYGLTLTMFGDHRFMMLFLM